MVKINEERLEIIYYAVILVEPAADRLSISQFLAVLRARENIFADGETSIPT
jgi:hypothetical protein